VIHSCSGLAIREDGGGEEWLQMHGTGRRNCLVFEASA